MLLDLWPSYEPPIDGTQCAHAATLATDAASAEVLLVDCAELVVLSRFIAAVEVSEPDEAEADVTLAHLAIATVADSDHKATITVESC